MFDIVFIIYPIAKASWRKPSSNDQIAPVRGAQLGNFIVHLALSGPHSCALCSMCLFLFNLSLVLYLLAAIRAVVFRRRRAAFLRVFAYLLLGHVAVDADVDALVLAHLRQIPHVVVRQT